MMYILMAVFAVVIVALDQFTKYLTVANIPQWSAVPAIPGLFDLTYVQNVYEYVTENITYDHELAANIPVDYLPDVDRTIETGKGICLDYASLMTALLRSQGIPAKLVVGWSGTQYHAWISVYLKETGWVDGAIFFDGLNWSRLDPTLAAGNRGTSVKDYVNNNSNYKERFFY